MTLDGFLSFLALFIAFYAIVSPVTRLRAQLHLGIQVPLALLAITITATPGTAWVEYRTQDGRLLLHVFDEEEEGYWRRVVKNRYEAMLMEVFE